MQEIRIFWHEILDGIYKGHLFVISYSQFNQSLHDFAGFLIIELAHESTSCTNSSTMLAIINWHVQKNLFKI